MNSQLRLKEYISDISIHIAMHGMIGELGHSEVIVCIDIVLNTIWIEQVNKSSITRSIYINTTISDETAIVIFNTISAEVRKVAVKPECDLY